MSLAGWEVENARENKGGAVDADDGHKLNDDINLWDVAGSDHSQQVVGNREEVVVKVGHVFIG